MSQTTVFSIAEDSDGFMWFRTEDGINRYDGFNTKVYRHNPADPGSVPDERELYIFCDSSGMLWARTPTRTFHFDRHTEKFIPVPSSLTDMKAVCDLRGTGFESDRKWMLFISDAGLVKADPFDGSVEPICKCPGIKDAVSAGNRLLFVDSDDNLLCMVSGSGGFSLLASLNSYNFMRVAPDGSLWVSDGSGLRLFFTDSDPPQTLTVKDGLLSSNLTDLAFDVDGNAWVGSRYGLNIIDCSTFEVHTVSSDMAGPNSLSGNWIRCLFPDSNGGMWVGTHYYGADYYNPFRQSFKTFSIGAGNIDKRSLVISSVTPNPDGNLWVGTNLSGDFRMNPQTGAVLQRHRLGRYPGPLEATAHMAGKTVFGYTNSGLTVMDNDTGRETSVLDSCTVYCMGKFDDRHLLASTTKGLYVLDVPEKRAGRIHSALDGRQVRFISSSGDGVFWFAATGELISATLSLSSDVDVLLSDMKIHPEVRFVVEFVHKDGILWIASLRGLFRLDIASGDCSLLGLEDGLPSAVIRGIELGNDGNLWLATEGNIVKYDISAGEFHIYGYKDGIEGARYNTRVHCSTDDGRLYFGSTSGLTVFRPNAVSHMTKRKSPVIFGPPSIRFRHRADVLKFTFSYPEFVSARKPEMEYLLSGIDKSWTSDDGGSVVYHNVPHGDYEFRLRLKNDHSRETQVSVIVSPAWYESGFVLALAVLLFFAAPVCVIIREKKESARKLAVANEDARKKLEKERRAMMEDVWRYRVGRVIGDGNVPNGKDMEFLLKVFRTLWDNMAREDYSVNELASDLCMTRTNLYIKIKNSTGLSAVEFVKRARILKSVELISKGNKSVTDLAFAVGFSSATYFATCFKQVMGKTPTEWMSADR